MNTEKQLFSGEPKTMKSMIFLVAACGVFVMLPAFLRGFPVGADFDNHFRFVLPFYEEMSRGNYLPGWLAESNNGFGDARFRFYPPFLYYLLSLFRFLTGDWYYASLLVFTLFSVVGVLGVYFWARHSLRERTAALAAALAALAPYHVAQFYQASLLAEFAAASLLPYAFWAVEKLTTGAERTRREKLFATAKLAAVYSLIVTTHLPTTVIGSLALGVFALVSTDWKNNKKALIFCAAGIALGLISSAWFWVRMLSELTWIQAGEKVSSDYYDYRNNFIFSPFSPSNLNTWYGGFVAALTIGLFLPSLLIWRRIFRPALPQSPLNGFFTDREDKVCRRLCTAFILTILSLLMTTDLSRPVWALVPKLKDVQFPYRWLVVTSVLMCPPAALGISFGLQKIREKGLRRAHVLLGLAFCVAFFLTVYDLVYESAHFSREQFTQRIKEVRGARSFNDWLPRTAREVKHVEALAGQVDAGTRPAFVNERQTHRRVFTVAGGAENAARMRAFYYPLWEAWTIKNGEKIRLRTAPAADGTLLVALPPERATIEVVFREPPRTGISLIVAGFGWALIIAVCGIYLIGTRKAKF
jgi:hypothetical protein